MTPGGFQSVQRVEGDENFVPEIAIEHARFMRRLEALEHRQILDECEEPNRTTLARELARQTLVHVELGFRRYLDCDDAWVGGIAEQQAVAVKLRRNFLVGF